ncbi:MAG: tRNA threonylcarbamoyladenosine dehydratase [Acidaminococcaceae bacterium]
MDLSRVEIVIGSLATSKLQAAKVAVVGLGGVGSYIAEALARSGVGSLLLIDADNISASNINRQLPALQSTMGRSKVEVMRKRLLDINPACQIEVKEAYYEPGDFATFFSGHFDYIADAIDAVASKVDLVATAHQCGIRTISALGTGNKLDPTRLQITDIAKTHTCPLARAVRSQLKKLGITDGVDVVFSDETPQRVPGAEVPGSMIFVPATAGLLMSSVIVRALIK